MKKGTIQPYYIRKVVKVSKNHNSWNLNIPQELIRILKIDQEYVQLQIIHDTLIIKKNKNAITKKDLEKMNSQEISEKTTLHSISNEILDENGNTESTVKELDEGEEMERINKILFGKKSDRRDHKEEMSRILDEARRKGQEEEDHIENMKEIDKKIENSIANQIKDNNKSRIQN